MFMGSAHTLACCPAHRCIVLPDVAPCTETFPQFKIDFQGALLQQRNNQPHTVPVLSMYECKLLYSLFI